jgi:hypothetical protein
MLGVVLEEHQTTTDYHSAIPARSFRLAGQVFDSHAENVLTLHPICRSNRWPTAVVQVAGIGAKQTFSRRFFNGRSAPIPAVPSTVIVPLYDT